MSSTTGQLQPAPEVAGIFHLMSHLSPGRQSEPSIAACDQSEPSLGPATRSLGPPRGAQRVATGVSSQESHERPAMARCDSDSLRAKRFYLFWLEHSSLVTCQCWELSWFAVSTLLRGSRGRHPLGLGSPLIMDRRLEEEGE